MDIVQLLQMAYDNAAKELSDATYDLDYLTGYYRGRADAFEHALNILKREEEKNEAHQRL